MADVILTEETTVVVEQPPEVVVVTVAEAGPPGPQGLQGLQGLSGLNGTGYTHTQASPAEVWTIAHNLGIRPSVSTYSVGGVEMIGSVTHLSDNVTQLDFLTPVAGTARLN